jgi:beta-galactosidase/beta-glucuronidase
MVAMLFAPGELKTDKGVAKRCWDEAHQYGLKVMMGIDIARERHGFDYNDPVAVQKQLEDVQTAGIALKDHPALIIWGIGNELNLLATNPKVWDAVNDISKMIHEIDPNHLTTTSLAWYVINSWWTISSREHQTSIC